MGFISKIGGWLRYERSAAPGDQRPPDADDFWYEPTGAFSQAGQLVTPETALTVSAVWRAIAVLSGAIAAMPLIVYRRMADGGKERATDHPLYELLHDQPNSWQTAFDFKLMLMLHLLLRGNFYAEIVPGPRGFADSLEPLHPDRVNPVRLPNKRIRYDAAMPDGTTRRFTQDEIFHVRGLSNDGLKGIGPIDVARQSLGLTMAADTFGAKFFGNGAMPSVALTHPGELSEAAQARIRADWVKKYGGPRAQGVAVLEENMKLETISFNAEQAQFLETRQFQVGEVARWFGVPPHKLYDLERATFSNIEQQSLDFVTDSALPWATGIEQATRRDLILAPGTYFVEFLFEALLRADSAARAAFYKALFEIGSMSQNDVRRRENLNPIPNGDIYFVPLNMRDSSQPAPPAPAPRERETTP